MIIFGTCVGGDGEKYRSVAGPSIDRTAASDDLILSASGDIGICRVYNQFLEEARLRDDCDAVVLLHDDVEIIDPNFRAKVLEAVGRENVGVVGVVGAANVPGLAWWDARKKSGRVFESRGLIDFGNRRADLDVVDGLMLIVSPAAFRSLDFDVASFPSFHGYDIDYCLQARSVGLRVLVAPIDLVHRTKGGFGDRQAFASADVALGLKWPDFIHPSTPAERLRDGLRVRIALLRRKAGSVRRRARLYAARSGAVPTVHAASHSPVTAKASSPEPGEAPLYCPCCRTPLWRPTSAEVTTFPQCSACGTGMTWPPPRRDVEGDGLWVEMYGASRLARRTMWMSQARKRVEWLQLYVAEGCLLEIGSGTGEFLRVAEDHGYETYGVETSHWAAEQAKKLGVEIEAGYLSDWRERYRGLRPDVVAMWHVLEHVPDPAGFLDEIRHTMRPGGTLVLEVPNGASSTFARLGSAWEGAQPDDHFFHYTPKGIELMLSSAGFTLQHVLPISRRIYAGTKAWQDERNEALLQGTDWPALDLLRVVCVATAENSSDLTATTVDILRPVTPKGSFHNHS